MCKNNHIIDYEASERLEEKSNKLQGWIKKRAHIQPTTPTMNKSEGAW